MKVILPAVFAFLAISPVVLSAKEVRDGEASDNTPFGGIQPFKLNDAAGKLKMELKEDGAISVNGQDIGALTGDGVMVGNDGKELARLKADGTILDEKGKAIGKNKILANGDIGLAGVGKLSWKGGKLEFGEGGAQITLDPDSPKARRWASFFLLLHYTAVPE